MSAKLQLLARRMERQSPMGGKAPAPETSGLGAAIDALIEERIEQALAKEREQQRQSPKVERLMQSFNKPVPAPVQPLPQTPKPPPVVTSKVTRRDEFGRILWSDSTIEGTGKVFRTVMTRDELGGVSSARTFLLPDQAPPPPPMPDREDV